MVLMDSNLHNIDDPPKTLTLFFMKLYITYGTEQRECEGRDPIGSGGAQTQLLPCANKASQNQVLYTNLQSIMAEASLGLPNIAYIYLVVNHDLAA